MISVFQAINKLGGFGTSSGGGGEDLEKSKPNNTGEEHYEEAIVLFAGLNKKQQKHVRRRAPRKLQQDVEMKDAVSTSAAASSRVVTKPAQRENLSVVVGPPAPILIFYVVRVNRVEGSDCPLRPVRPRREHIQWYFLPAKPSAALGVAMYNKVATFLHNLILGS